MDFFVCHDPKQHLELLLLADPYEPMIDRYLPQSIVLTAMEKGKTVGLIAYCPVAGGAWEIKNLAVKRRGRAEEWAGHWCSRSKTACLPVRFFWSVQPGLLPGI